MIALFFGIIIAATLIIFILPDSPIRKYLKKGLITGIVLATINAFSLGLPGGFVFSGFLAWIPYNCSGEICMGYSIAVGSIFFLMFTPSLFVFITYIFDKQHHPFTWKKFIFIIFIILIAFFIYISGLFEYRLKSFELNNEDLAHHTYYKPGTRCEMLYSHFPFATNALISDCYGFFAAQKNDPSLCDNINGIDDRIYGKESARINCISSYSIQKNDINYCKKLSPNAINSCQYKYFVIMGDKKGCNELPSSYSHEVERKNKCLKNINFLNQLMFKYLELKDRL